VITISTRGRAESERLTRALITIASCGLRTHCSDPGTSELWLSEHEAERAEAVKLCRGCPVIQPCGQAAEERDERWGVWGESTAASDQEEKEKRSMTNKTLKPMIIL
jgi:hypothetical protein